MMTLKVFCIKDSKAEAFMVPFFESTVGVAIRRFQIAANKDGSDFQKFGEDFTLFETGSWSDTTGLVTPLDCAKSVINGLDVRDITVRGGE